MVRLSKADNETKKQNERRNRNRLKSIKSDFVAGNIEGFQQIYDVVAISWIAEKLGMGFTTLKNKSGSPGDFTLNEIKRYADLVGLGFEEFLDFIKNLMKQSVRASKK